MVQVHALTDVDIRTVWPDEARDFTPWLAENLDGLGKVLGMDLELESTEAPVGPFAVDILAKDADSNRKVVIENQFGRTNHDHLGKVLTYAGVLGAGVMVLIAEDFRDEHRQALDWLNQRTSFETEFYGIVVRAVKIGDSEPAYQFELAAQPNQAQKSVTPSVGNHPSSERAEIFWQFFQGVVDRLREVHQFTKSRKSTTGSFKSFSARIPGINYTCSFPSTGARVEIGLVDQRDPVRNTKLFETLYNQKDVIESAFGAQLTWEPLETRKMCRISLNRSGAITNSQEMLKEIADWMVENLVNLRDRVVNPYVRDAVDELDAQGAGDPDDYLEDERDEE